MLNLHFELCLVGVIQSISLGAFSEDQGEFEKNRHMQVQEQGQGYQRAHFHTSEIRKRRYPQKEENPSRELLTLQEVQGRECAYIKCCEDWLPLDDPLLLRTTSSLTEHIRHSR